MIRDLVQIMRSRIEGLERFQDAKDFQHLARVTIIGIYDQNDFCAILQSENLASKFSFHSSESYSQP